MIKGFLYCLISTVMLNSFNNLSASSINENSSENKQYNEITNNNTQNNKQYWDEFLPTIKCYAKETLKERFDCCTNWIIKLLNSKTLLYKISSFNRYKYIIDNIDEVIDIQNFTNEIKMRKNLLNDISNKENLNGNAWSEIPLRIFGYNEEHRRNIGQYLQWHCKLLDNHWNMKFKKNYEDVKLNFYASYEYQTPKFYEKKTIDSEQVLSVCLSAIEMDLLTSNHLTSNIELFANHLISKKDKVAEVEVNRYRKYFTDKQNKLLANHIFSYYLSFPRLKTINVAKYLTVYFILNDMFKNLKPNTFLLCIQKCRNENWFDVILNKYLDNEFGTKYNKSYLNSFKKVVLEDKTYFNNHLVPKFHKYIKMIFKKLIELHKGQIQCEYDDYLQRIEKEHKAIDKDIEKKYNTSLIVLNALNSAVAGYQSGFKTIENIIGYVDFKQKGKLNKKKAK